MFFEAIDIFEHFSAEFASDLFYVHVTVFVMSFGAAHVGKRLEALETGDSAIFCGCKSFFFVKVKKT